MRSQENDGIENESIWLLGLNFKLAPIPKLGLAERRTETGQDTRA